MSERIRIAIEVDPETLARAEEDAHRSGRPVEHILGGFARKGSAYPTGASIMIFGKHLEELERILSHGSILNQTDLLEKVQRLAGISFFHIRLPFTPNQLAQLQEKAERQGFSVEQLVARTAPRVYEQFFDLVPR